jgi:16S rRNA A1518/A1519 N6-dimethyltransferase RsmA/KsgA/DIM1 with predicted DNA glycosylase/AP lyase activity
MPGPRSPFRTFVTKLRKRRIIATLAAFIGGGWLLVEVGAGKGVLTAALAEKAGRVFAIEKVEQLVPGLR